MWLVYFCSKHFTLEESGDKTMHNVLQYRSGTHTEKSLLGLELKFSVMGGKKKRGNTIKNSIFFSRTGVVLRY